MKVLLLKTGTALLLILALLAVEAGPALASAGHALADLLQQESCCECCETEDACQCCGDAEACSMEGHEETPCACVSLHAPLLLTAIAQNVSSPAPFAPAERLPLSDELLPRPAWVRAIDQPPRTPTSV